MFTSKTLTNESGWNVPVSFTHAKTTTNVSYGVDNDSKEDPSLVEEDVKLSQLPFYLLIVCIYIISY